MNNVGSFPAQLAGLQATSGYIGEGRREVPCAAEKAPQILDWANSVGQLADRVLKGLSDLESRLGETVLSPPRPMAVNGSPDKEIQLAGLAVRLRNICGTLTEVDNLLIQIHQRLEV